ncbi:Cif family virulence factor [Salininema proteolyticum]|uniref:DUF4440 domain-containing protein n=1 Tax=Salininema proteolyticum TaxID=1607685 RepID=A0ABV8TYB0_9ACTN
MKPTRFTPVAATAAAALLALAACSSAEDDAQEAAEDIIADMENLDAAIAEADVDAIHSFADEHLCADAVDSFKKSFEGYEELSPEDLEGKGGGAEYDPADIKVAEVTVDGDTAEVTIEGSGTDPLTRKKLDDGGATITFVKEGDDWKSCPFTGSEEE